MDTHFKVKVTVSRTYEVDVIASGSIDAVQKARVANLAGLFPVSEHKDVAKPIAIGECRYSVGFKVEHTFFGTGTIKFLEASVSGDGQAGYVATIHFDDGDIRKIGLPMPLDKLRVV